MMVINQPAAAPPKTAAQYVVEQLAAWGCRTIYGVAGDAILYFLDAVAGQTEIRYINCRLETTAALMASAEAKLTGRLAVCTATSGPGIASLLNGLGDASQDQAPVLAITGQVERKDIGTGVKQEINQQQLIHPMAVYSALTADARALPVQLNLAMKKAFSMGGVAHLAVPKEVWMEAVDAPLYPLMPARPTPAPGKSETDVAVSLLNGCSRPVILAGRGVKDAQQELLTLAEKLGAPIMTTLPARSSVPNDHRLYIGGLGQSGSDIASDLLKEADLCLILGATWWPEDYVPKGIPIVQVDAAFENIGGTMPVTASVVGDMAKTLPPLTRGIADSNRWDWLRQVQDRKTEWKAQIEVEAHLDTRPVAPQRVVSALQRTVAPDVILTLDVGDLVLWFNRIFQADRQEILISGRWRTLGFGLPAAMAARLAEPNRQVVALVGDGGFGTTLADLATAVAYELPITIVLINNASYAMERNRMIQAGLHTLGSRPNNPDFAAMANAFGAEGVQVKTTDQLEPALRKALVSEKVTLVDVLCDDPIVPHTKI
ncbi:pyruvate dehydrogenase (quinone)/pyruvate oxidase [Melghirimyces profundicolus]|uniref:Pyruvate dehydrogenase (Quinone)/pyruvate oxidase n=1 Tax=Melghirimyces profundicolus TaxID=1242148 RepID=A0A2T6B5Y0_9BACL|nr:thiamine pyrophosphate-binding protein [Melghirimyces profundicolus]PTX51479.1 pyruvate dehydrogenase (quinone)/pyruvate oxidase [Melghirimyces profundicolus]